MKKSTIFMMVYVGVLFVVPIVGIFYDSEIVVQIALAATISGAFLAVSDLCANLSEEWNKQIKFSSKELLEAEELCHKIKLTFEELMRKVTDALIKSVSFKGRKEFLKIKNGLEKQQKSFERKFFNRNGRIRFRNIPERMRKLMGALSIIFIILGLAAFLLVYMIPDAIPLFLYRQEWFSVYGFAFVALNYLVTDTAQGRIDKKIRKYKKRISEYKKMKKDLGKYFVSNGKERVMLNSRTLRSSVLEDELCGQTESSTE